MATDTITAPSNAEDLARLSDSELRAAVLNDLEQTSPQGTDFNPADIAYQAQEALAILQERLTAILGSYNELPIAMGKAWQLLTENREAGGLSDFFLLFVTALIIGGFTHWGLKPLKARILGQTDTAQTISLTAKVKRFGACLLADGMRIIGFGVAASLVFLILAGDDPRDRLAFVFYLSACLLMLGVTAFLQAYLSLSAPNYRIALLDDSPAKRLFISQLVAMALGAFGFFTCALFAVLGVTGDAHYLLLTLIGVALTGGLVGSYVLEHRTLSNTVQAGATQGLRARLAPLFPWALITLAIGLFAGIVISGLLGLTPLFGAGLVTLAIATYWPPVDAAFSQGAKQAQEKNEMLTAAGLRVARLLLGVVLLLTLILVWRFDLFGLNGPVGLGVLITRAALQVGFVALIAYAAWESLRLSLDHKIAEEQAVFEAQHGDMGEMEIGGAGMSRLGTLLPLIKRSGQVLIAVIAFMITLSTLGIDIAPVLAGAGVVGLAIGFGSQTLVRDIVSGAFFLIDDAFRQGEYIDLGEVKGSVEKIRARCLQLRHHRGALNTVPFGEISTIQNYSRDWAIMKLRFRLAFDTDLEKVRKLLKRVGLSLLEHPDVGEDFLQPFKSQGVVEVDDYGLVISTKFMCKPGRQFLIRRHAYAAVQQAFAENDIHFSRPEVRVAMEGETAEENGETRPDKAVAEEAVATVIATTASKGDTDKKP